MSKKSNNSALVQFIIFSVIFLIALRVFAVVAGFLALIFAFKLVSQFR